MTNYSIVVLINFDLQGTDKTWVEDPPARISYKSLYSDASTEEESTNIVFIILATIFVTVVVCCSYEVRKRENFARLCIFSHDYMIYALLYKIVNFKVWRNNKQHKKRLERETDESIIWSKEQATKMHESPGLGLRSHTYKTVRYINLLNNAGKRVICFYYNVLGLTLLIYFRFPVTMEVNLEIQRLLKKLLRWLYRMVLNHRQV